MVSTRSFWGLVALSLSLQSVTAQTITQCPTAGSAYTGSDGSKYALCPSTDFVGASGQIIANTVTAAACAELCVVNTVCLKAVYDNIRKNCHVKSNAKNALTWAQSNDRYTAIYINNTLPEASDIARCPLNEASTVLNNKTYKTCGNTDIRGASAQQVANVASTAACATLCSVTGSNGCANAVYDKQNRVCHIKAEAVTNTLIWYTNKRYDVIRQDIAPTPATKGSWSDLIRLPVIPVAAYVVPSFPEVSRLMLWSSWGADAFGGEGGMTQFADYNFQK